MRIERLDPLVVDTALALGLTFGVALLVLLVSTALPSGLPSVPNMRGMRFRQEHGSNPVAYLLIAATFMPLALRRRVPWLALSLSGGAALLYVLRPMLPPAPTILGPMIALYTLAAHSKKRHVGLMALIVAGVVVAVPVFSFSSTVRWVAEAVAAFVMLAAAALLGEAERNRHEYVAEVERRAAEAERSREEEARRRVDEERIRIARDVHDIVAHGLSTVTVQAGAAEALLESDPGRAREAIGAIRATGKDALAELRSMLDVLRTGDADAPRTPVADIAHVEDLARPLRDAGLEVHFDVSGDLEDAPAYAGVSAYRIVQEALTNVLRHAEAHEVSVRIAVGADCVELSVVDDGTGAPHERVDAEGGHGVRGMRERVEALGGAFEAGPAAGAGFRVSASIPLSRSAS